MNKIDVGKREFLQGSLVGAGLLVGGVISKAVSAHQPTSGLAVSLGKGKDPHGMIIGQGDFRYRVNRKWGILDSAKHPVTNCHGIEVDSKNRVVLVTDGNHENVIVYDRNGKYIESWGARFPGAHACKIVQEGDEEFIFIVDCGWYLGKDNKWYRQSGSVSKLTMNGTLVFSIGHPQTIGVYEPTQRYQPADIAIADNGDFYVSDGYGSDFVIQYNHQGQYIRHFGGGENKADPKGSLKNSHGLNIDSRDPKNPHLVISSRSEQALKMFTMEGRYMKTVKLPGAYVGRPLFHNGNIYAGVCWSHIDGKKVPNSGFVSIMDENYKVISNPGGMKAEYANGVLQPMHSSFDVFDHVHNICIDDEDNIYVAQWRANGTYPIKLEKV